MTTRNKLLLHLALTGLILGTLLLYYPPFDWAFVGDDYVQFDYIKEVIADPWVGFSLFNPYYLPWYYRPLQLVWFSFLEAIFHFAPQGFYWTALLFHALATALVYRVARQFGLGWMTAVLAAALLAIHSHWVDVVSWISSIAIVIAAIFSLAAVSAWLSYLQRPSTRQLLLTLLFSLLTFLSHEESILLPPILLAILLAQRGVRANWQLKKFKMSAFTSVLFQEGVSLFCSYNLDYACLSVLPAYTPESYHRHHRHRINRVADVFHLAEVVWLCIGHSLSLYLHHAAAGVKRLGSFASCGCRVCAVGAVVLVGQSYRAARADLAAIAPHVYLLGFVDTATRNCTLDGTSTRGCLGWFWQLGVG